MPAKGWLSVRDLPTTKEKTIKEVMLEFKNSHEICDCCEGKGYTVNKYDEYFEGVSTVKFSDNEDLQELFDDGHLTGDTIKKIIETAVHGRQQCDKCKGFGFVETSRKKPNGKKSIFF